MYSFITKKIFNDNFTSHVACWIHEMKIMFKIIILPNVIRNRLSGTSYVCPRPYLKEKVGFKSKYTKLKPYKEKLAKKYYNILSNISDNLSFT